MQYEFMDKSRENLKEAEICFENNLYNASVNRAYYDAFHAAISALAARGIKKEKFDHKWVQAEFSGRLIKRSKAYPAKVKAYLMKMQIVRNDADYKVRQISRKKAQGQLAKAGEMLALVRKELER